MKSYCLIMLAVLMAGCVTAEPKKKVTFRVKDAETMDVLTNATVTVFNKTYDGNWKTKKVDSSGSCTFEGRGMSFGWTGRAKLDGYYDSKPRAEYKTINHVLNRWEPWNPSVEVKMRPIKNPVPMVCKSVEWKFKIPKYNTPIGLDLEQGDWVQPYGNGIVSDMMIEIIPFDPPEKGSQCRITFPNPQDGIQEHEFKWPSSELKWPYLAPTNGYINTLERNYVLNFPKVAGAPEHSLKENVNYLIRTRTQIDEDGNIISACYGYFEGEIRFLPKGEFKFKYCFNPVPNERSLEWNGKNLLKKK